ncbi:MAG: DUF4397 domain-containing protein [Anaerolineales bacterium]
MRKIFPLLLVIFMSLALWPSRATIAQDAVTDMRITYRFLNLTDQNVDLYRAGEVVFFDVAPRTPSAERTLAVDEAPEFSVYAANDTPGEAEPFLEGGVELSPGSDALLILTNTGGELAWLVHIIDTTPLAPQRARLEVLHLADEGPLNLVGQNDDTLSAALPGEAMRSAIPSGGYQYRLQDAADADVLQATLEAQPGTVTTLILTDDADDLHTISLRDTVPQQAAIRLVHAGRIAPAVDIYFNDVMLVSNLAYQELSDYTALAPDTYRVSIYEAGQLPAPGTALWEGNVELTASAPRTGVILGEASLRLITYLDDHQLIPQDRARLRIVNAALNLPLLTVRQAEQNAPLVGGLEYALGSGNQNLEPGSLALTFRETDGIDLRMEDFDLQANHYYTLVTVGNALIEDEFGVLVLDWNWMDGTRVTDPTE